MKKRIFRVIVVFISIFLMLGTSNYIYSQKKKEEKKKVEVKERKTGGVKGGVTGEVKGGIAGGVKGGVAGGVTGGISGGVEDRQDKGVWAGTAAGAFNIKTVELIKMKVNILEIKPAETVRKTNAVVVAEDGGKAEFRFGTHSIKAGEYSTRIRIKINPKIIVKKGIELKLSIKISPVMKNFVEKTVLTENYGEVIVELFKNKKEKKKLVVKITPFIEKVPGAQEYPGPVTELKLNKALIFMNEKVISKGSSVSASSDRGEIALFFHVGGKGLSVLSFKPFKGAKAIGAVNENIIIFKLNGDEFVLESNDSFLPRGKWLVWVRNIPGWKPDRRLVHIKKDMCHIGILAGDFDKYLFNK